MIRPACGAPRCALGVYLVGAIDPADRSAVDEHLAECTECRDELAGLAGLPALLGRVPAAEATRMLLDGESGGPPSQPALVSLLGRVVQLRRHLLYPRLAAAAVAGLIAGGGVAMAAHALVDPQPPPGAAAHNLATTVRGTDPRTHASAIVRYQDQPWGLQLAVQVAGIPAGTRCWLHVTTLSGRQVASGSWTVAAGHQDAWYAASSSVRLAAARAFVITAGSRTLLTVPIR
jgi:hypothetical protein